MMTQLSRFKKKKHLSSKEMLRRIFIENFQRFADKINSNDDDNNNSVQFYIYISSDFNSCK
jgi:hypothetical protein